MEKWKRVEHTLRRNRRPRRRNVPKRANVSGKNMQITGVNLSLIIAIIGLAVILGFLTTKFFVYPMLLGQEASFETDFGRVIAGYVAGSGDGDASTTEAENQNPVVNPGGQEGDQNADSGVDDNAETVNADNLDGYCIQYGSFSTKAAADELMAELKATGLTAQIVETDGNFKVIGQIFTTKAEASEAKESVILYASPEYADVFVTNL